MQIVKIVQDFGFEFAKNNRPLLKIWTCMQGTGVWRLIAVFPTDTIFDSQCYITGKKSKPTGSWQIMY